MKIRLSSALFLLGFLSVGMVRAQEGPPQEAPFINEADLDQELDSANGPVTPKEEILPEAPPPAPEIKQEKVLSNPKKSSTYAEEPFVAPQPLFVKPPGPKKGGSVKVQHPNAAKGLLRINKDGSYQYRTGMRAKSKSSSLRLGTMTPPKIYGGSSAAGTVTYDTMYGKSNVFSLVFEYEWQPFTSFGRLGLNMGTGFATARGNGYFKNDRGAGNSTQAQEVYNLYMLPVSAFLNYRFEYARRQWIVPYINGGATMYGLIEARDDGKTPNVAGAAAVGGGGGVLFSITAWDAQGAFTLDREYGIADMYFSLEARVMQGLSKNIDFTTQTINGGITVDF